jgi:hypothetical protein
MTVKIRIRDSKVLVIAFCGFNDRLMMPTWRFKQEAKLKDVSWITLSDPSRHLYLKGIGSELPTFAALLDELRSQIAQIEHTRLIMIGTSGGSHAAMLSAHLLKADEAVVFAPFPYLDIEIAKALGDRGVKAWGRVGERIKEIPDVAQYLDLRNVLKDWNGKTEYKLHSGTGEDDLKRAEYIADMPHVTLFKHAVERHSVASHLAEYGQLANCFDSAMMRS